MGLKLFATIEKVEQQGDGTVRVHGIASTESVDEQGEIVLADAMREALPGYMKFGNIREMHQLSAAGTTLTADVGDDKVTRIVTHIVDPTAVLKIKNRVYKGFSIGGSVTQRDSGNPKRITGVILTEISLVDRPANPEAIFECWKASAADLETKDMDSTTAVTPPDTAMAAAFAGAGFASAGLARDNAPQDGPGVVQRWVARDDSKHLTKSAALKHNEQLDAAEAVAAAAKPVLDAMAELDAGLAKREGVATTDGPLVTAAALKAAGEGEVDKGGDAPGDGDKPYGDVEYADPGHQSDGKKRYPIDNERHIRAAWSYINKPGNCDKYSGGDCAKVKARIVAAWKDKIDSDGPPSASEKAFQSEIQYAFGGVGYVSREIEDLLKRRDSLALEAAMEGNEPPPDQQIGEHISVLCKSLNDHVVEAGGPSRMLSLAAGPEAAHDKWLTALLADIFTVSEVPRLVLAKAGSKYSRHDQALIDATQYLVGKAMSIPGVPAGTMGHLQSASEAFKSAGAQEAAAGGDGTNTGSATTAPIDSPPAAEFSAGDNATVDTGRNAETTAPSVTPPGAEFSTGDNATVDTGRNASTAVPQVDPDGDGSGSGIDQLKSAIIEDLAKRGGHKVLMDVAHHLVSKLSGGMTCAAAKAGARQSAATMGFLRAGHDHLVAAGAKCSKADNAIPGGAVTGDDEEEGQGTSTTAGGAGKDKGEFATGKAAEAMPILSVQDAADLVKGENDGALSKAVAERDAAFAKMGEIGTQMAELTKRMKALEDQPMPALAVAMEPAVIAKIKAEHGVTDVSKAQDGGGSAAGRDEPLSEDAIVKALAKMSAEERGIVALKANRLDPSKQFILPGSAARG